VGLFTGVGDLFSEIMDGGDDVFHYTFGAGVVIMDKLQIDIATDIEDNGERNTFIISAAYQY